MVMCVFIVDSIYAESVKTSSTAPALVPNDSGLLAVEDFDVPTQYALCIFNRIALSAKHSLLLPIKRLAESPRLHRNG
jgi:hypothetical protein